MCLKKITGIFWLLFCFLPPVQPLEITEEELSRMEELQQTQLALLEKSADSARQLETRTKLLQAQLTRAREQLTRASALSTQQQTQIDSLRETSEEQLLQISKLADSYSAYVIDAEQKQAVLTAKISARNKAVIVLSVVIGVIVILTAVKIIIFKRL